ncbi:alpha/beta hydrolase [Rhabdothermincola salaria]|uniref:alpha/beta hydrolase n=1 Tax=Rhabdothermincola salaria TaxID=2903142 RepID=UPI001E4866E1|nr:alpha/beta hydrolase [Rhabdothermincola salaria]MCD9623918.1 alpha/beta hydrolase [Rhabdothermincola salaria]
MTRRNPMGKLMKLTVVAAGIGAGVAFGRKKADTRLADCDPELRVPALALPLSLTSERGLRFMRSLPSRPTPVADGVSVDDRIATADGADDVRVLVYRPDQLTEPAGALVWIHGGGLVLGQPEMDNDFCSTLARDLGIVVVSVDYRLAPEHPFPAPLDDCHTALRWVHDHAGTLGIDAARVAVGGGSAGGGLAASLAQRARDDGGPPIAFQLLAYPMIDDRTSLRRDHEGRGQLLWTPESNRFGWASYLGHIPTYASLPPYAAAARTDDLAGLPPTWIGVGALDLFHDEDVDYAERLRAAGVACEVHITPGMYHAAERFKPDASASRRFTQHMTEALRAAVGAPDPATVASTN